MSTLVCLAGGYTHDATRSRASLLFVLGLNIILSHSVATVDADDWYDLGEDEPPDNNLCGKSCRYGCCDKKCCDPDNSVPRYTYQIIGVVGAFFITLILLLMCFARYRCMAKRNQITAQIRGDEERGRSAVARASIYALNVPMQNVRQLLTAFASSDLPLRRLSTPRELLVSPPPYTEQDPLTSHGSQSTSQSESSSTRTGDLPPAYADAVKDSVITPTRNENRES